MYLYYNSKLAEKGIFAGVRSLFYGDGSGD